MTAPIYLDNNATTPMDPEVLEAMLPHLRGLAGNPSSGHGAGREARRAIDAARRRIAEALSVEPAAIVFTSGATEANNLAMLPRDPPAAPGHVLVSPSEHPSALDPALRLSRFGYEVEMLALDESGRGVDLAARLRPETQLVVVQLANSETGTIQPVGRLADALAPGTRWHVDAVQAVGKIPVDFQALGATSLAISAHKIHGPVGVGALLARPEALGRPLLLGGRQQFGRRAGTEPVALIAGLGKAVELAVRNLEANARRMAERRDRLEALLLEHLDGVVLNAPREARLCSTSNLSFAGVSAEALVIALDLDGVACSTGTACASGAAEPSAVLRAMGLPAERVASAVRFSVSRTTTQEEIERAAVIVVQAVRRLRGGADRTRAG